MRKVYLYNNEPDILFSFEKDLPFEYLGETYLSKRFRLPEDIPYLLQKEGDKSIIVGSADMKRLEKMLPNFDLAFTRLRMIGRCAKCGAVNLIKRIRGKDFYCC